MGVYGVARLGSIHNTYNVPSELERAAKGRSCELFKLQNPKYIFLQVGLSFMNKFGLIRIGFRR